MTGAAAILAEASFWQRLAENPAYHRALAAGLAIALMCSVLSVFVVLKRMAFIGQGISHAAFGGVGAAMLLGLFVPAFRPVLARDGLIAAFCIITAVGIGYLARRGRLGEDTAIGICLVAAMALGLLLLDLRAQLLQQMLASGQLERSDVGYAAGFHEILFGNILFLSRQEVFIAWALAIAVTAAVAATFRELVFFAFDEETAGVFGVRTTLLYYGLLVCLGLAVVAAMRTLGVILASALLILPGASARMWSDRIGRVMLISVAVGLAGLTAGLLAAVYLRHASPAGVIVLAFVVLFALSCAAGALRHRAARRR